MAIFKKTLITVSIIALAYFGNTVYQELAKVNSDDPTVWEDDIVALEEELADTPAKSDSILFIGSSSIRLWGSIHEDMYPFDVVQRGFGGAKFLDVIHYADRLIDIKVKPAALVFFVGTNDIYPGSTKTPAMLLQNYQQLIQIVRAKYPVMPVYYIAITPSLMRWKVWETAHKTNLLIEEHSAKQSNLWVIDTKLLGANGKPNPDLYRFDRLHLNDEGYERWTKVILDRLRADLL